MSTSSLAEEADVFARDPREARDNQDGSARGVPHRKLKFMIDSGSDTVTLHHDVITGLCLSPIGVVIQEVADGETHEKPLYSACLGIGEERLHVEVIPDKVNTLGTPVLWKFRHCIDGDKHLWLAKQED